MHIILAAILVIRAGHLLDVNTGKYADDQAIVVDGERIESVGPDQPLPRRPNLADSVDEIANVVRRDLKYGADWIKLMGTGGILDPFSDYNHQELSDEQMAKAVAVAHRAGRKVMVHAEGTGGIK